MKRTHPGRPPLDEADRSERICLSVPSRTFDELDARARRERVTIPEIIRRDLEQQQKKYTN